MRPWRLLRRAGVSSSGRSRCGAGRRRCCAAAAARTARGGGAGWCCASGSTSAPAPATPTSAPTTRRTSLTAKISVVADVKCVMKKGDYMVLVQARSLAPLGQGVKGLRRPVAAAKNVAARYRGAVGLQAEAFWRRNYLLVVGAGGVIVCVALWRVMFGIASTFVGLSEGMAKYGFLVLATAMVAFAYDMKLLAVGIPMASGPDQRLFLVGDDQEYKGLWQRHRHGAAVPATTSTRANLFLLFFFVHEIWTYAEVNRKYSCMVNRNII